jgi:predicted AAA+ superfamily ATPase
MVFLAGPRQCGKTTFAKSLLKLNIPHPVQDYLNWDVAADREVLLKENFPPGQGMLLLDEIHKYSGWRQMVKGLFDKRHDELKIMVTGSGRLDYYRYSGDSLQGRYHLYRMHPFSYAELGGGQDVLKRLLQYGGFPEPYLAASEAETRRWSRSYRTRLLEEDLNKLEDVKDVALVERLLLRLPDLVGSPLSLNALREDLQVAHQTLARWVEILERLYAVFRIYPFGSPKIRAVKKEAKHYHYDWSLIEDAGARLENMVACHWLKWCHFMQDTAGWDMELRYFRDTDKREVDFVVMQEKKPIYFIEVKTSAKMVSDALTYLKRKFPEVPTYQVSLEDKTYQTKDGVIVCPLKDVLEKLV